MSVIEVGSRAGPLAAGDGMFSFVQKFVDAWLADAEAAELERLLGRLPDGARVRLTDKELGAQLDGVLVGYDGGSGLAMVEYSLGDSRYTTYCLAGELELLSEEDGALQK